MNRGRIQAQGNNTEKSSAWNEDYDHTKEMGLERVDNLENQLTRPEKSLRIRSLEKCRNRIVTTPNYGVNAPMKKSYYDDVRRRYIRVDIEVNAGIAFSGEINNN